MTPEQTIIKAEQFLRNLVNGTNTKLRSDYEQLILELKEAYIEVSTLRDRIARLEGENNQMWHSLNPERMGR